jgi:hypothetical protein
MTTERGNEASINDLREGEVMPKGNELVAGDSTAGLIAAGELDQQITTAKKYPRSITHFRKEAMDLATLNEQVAAECLFALRRENADGSVKVIEGPSIRLAEIIAYCWGNCRIGSRIVLEGQESVVVQGVFQDVQRNVVQTSEISRSILTKRKLRYGRDMITVTTNAAQAIAKRNAITAGVPRALWWDVYQAARRVAAGDAKSLSTKIKEAINAFQVYGITLPQILALLKRESEQEISRDDVLQLIGIYRAIKDEEVTPEEAFPGKPAPVHMLRPEPTAEESEAKARAMMAAHGVADEPVEEGGDKPAPKPPTQTIAPPGIAPPDDQVPGPGVSADLPGVGEDPPAPTPRARRRPSAVE